MPFAYNCLDFFDVLFCNALLCDKILQHNTLKNISVLIILYNG